MGNGNLVTGSSPTELTEVYTQHSCGQKRQGFPAFVQGLRVEQGGEEHHTKNY
jgi:hypothetical protein